MMRFMDGFDVNQSAAALALKWTTLSGTFSWVTGAYGKGKALTNFVSLLKSLGINITTGMQGFHFIWGGIAQTICTFLDSGSNQVDLRINGSGNFYFTRNGTVIGGVSSGSIAPTQIYWIECQTTINASTGVANLYVNNTSMLAQTGLNTQSTGNSSFNQVQINNDSTTFDSYHCWDTTAGDVTAFPYGEHLIDTALANGAGSNAAWSRGGTNTGANFSQENETNEDGDTTYVFPTASSQIDSYDFTNLAETSGTIGTIAINTISRIDDAPVVHQYEHYTLSSGTGATGASITPGANYLNAQTFQGTDPNTGIAWTLAGRNAAQFGFEDIS